MKNPERERAARSRLQNAVGKLARIEALVAVAVRAGTYRRFLPAVAAESYESLLAAVDDPHRFPATFEEWKEIAEETERHLAGEGRPIKWIEVDPHAFARWCFGNELDPGMDSLVLYSQVLAAERKRDASTESGG